MINTLKKEDLKENKEELLKNMNILRHTIADMLSSSSFPKDIKLGGQDGVISIDDEQFLVYISSAAADDLPEETTNDIYDDNNYLPLVSNDDMMWYALVEHINAKIENLQKENKELREELAAADNEINELEEDRKEANKIDEQAREAPESKAVFMDMETALMQQQITQLNTRIAQLESARETDRMEIEAAQKANSMLKENIHNLENNNAYLKKENESLKTKLDSTFDMINSVSSRNKELESENGVLKNENADFAGIAEAHLETTAKFAEYKDRLRRQYKHLKNVMEILEDLMETNLNCD